MRAVAAMLLMMMLPGLLLPAGIALRVCLCAPPAAGQPSCCAALEPAEPPSCCCCGAPASAGDRDGEGTCALSDCRCVWIQVPDDPQPPAPLPATDVASPPPPAFAAVALVPAALPPLRPWSAPDNRPPPPYRQRNLPLRL